MKLVLLFLTVGSYSKTVLRGVSEDGTTTRTTARDITIVQHKYGVLPNAAIEVEKFVQRIRQEIFDRFDFGLPYTGHLKTGDVITIKEFVVELGNIVIDTIMQVLGRELSWANGQ